MSEPQCLSVSVAMATYNGAKYIREQLDDLAGQTRLPAELVICDDGSSDDTLAIVEEFAAAAPFPVHIHRNPERLGYRANFIKCAGLCRSDLVGFCDQDDRWHARKIDVMARVFEDEDVLIAYHNARTVTSKGRTLPLLYRGRTEKRFAPLDIDPWFNPLGFTQVFRRSLLSFEELWPLSSDQNEEGERLAHDQWYFFLASGLGSIVYVPDVLADYRQHGENTYGMSWYRALAPQLTELWHATHQRTDRLNAAKERARIFRQIGDLSGVLRDRADAAACWYDHMAGLLRRRAELYDTGDIRTRVSTVRALVRSGAYGPGGAAWSRASLAMDATIGIVGAFPVLERIARRVTRR
ncbi:MAG TPA: glycosyltransferase [Sphingomicrobium sp.]|nr:glycosyltransferase [Sphingomicrobium sp.]